MPLAPLAAIRETHFMSKRIVIVTVLLLAAAGTGWWLLRAGDEDAPGPAAVQKRPKRPRPPSPVFTDSAGEAGEKADTAKVTPGFARIPAGTFQMGSPGLEPGRSPDELQHRVTISYDYELQITEVTQREYKALIGKNPSYSPECGDDCPVEQVSWFEAAHYCNELSRRRGLPICTTITEKETTWRGVLCTGYRLPTEAEWERAARGGSADPRHGGLDAIAWVDTNSQMRSHPVAGKDPNAYGLYDMLGNVFEWTWDWMGPYRKDPVADPTGISSGDNKVFRGGAYRWTKDEARHAFRNAYGPLNKVEFIGFRCARTLR